MRVTQNTTANNTIYNLQQAAAKINQLTDLTASGQNINKPSDDPIASKLLVDVGDKLKLADQYDSNMSKATTWLNYTSTVLTGMSDIINQVSKVAGTVNSGSTDPTLRQSVHDQLVDLKSQLVDMANTQYGDQYIFGGAKNTTPPFDITSPTNAYSGDSTQIGIEINQNSTISLNITGDRLLKGTGSSPSYGSTDILATLDSLIKAVGDSSTASDVGGISTSIIGLQDGTKQLNNATSDILSRTTRLSNMTTLNANIKNMFSSIVSNVQTVDYNKLGIELSQQQTAYSAALASTAKVQGLSLLNYLPIG